ncbi:MAG: tRNA pseudouridine(38-40) synthase TruA [Paludibacteraceae bacterium]|nr:tRNA pseudouridine(38-40) synthase TruA [Paludibacteraceae bacterium]
MMRYFIYFQYNGANYHGWQRQPNGSSVQATLEDAMSTLMRTPIALTGAGRTDAGVHARYMTAHFDTDTPFDATHLVKRLNVYLPADMAIFSIEQVADTLHARFDATARTYQYHVHTHKDAFIHTQSLQVPATLRFDLMNEAAKVLFEYIDFTSFSKLHTDVKTNNCTITHAEWTQISTHQWVFTITANRFLRNMVRAIVGTLLQVGTEKISIQEFRNIIESKDRCKAGTSAPAHALYLTKVTY